MLRKKCRVSVTNNLGGGGELLLRAVLEHSLGAFWQVACERCNFFSLPSTRDGGREGGREEDR